MKKVTTIWLTGGPCGGKSTAISQVKQSLEDRWVSVLTLPEAATYFFSDIWVWIWDKKLTLEQFQKHLLSHQLNWEETIRKIWNQYKNAVLILLDRTLIDSLAYMPTDTFNTILEWLWLCYDDLLNGARYDSIIDLVTAADGAEDFYTLENNEARIESPEQARELQRKIQEAYKWAHNLSIVDNSWNFSQKIENVKAAIYTTLWLEFWRFQRTFCLKDPDLSKIREYWRRVDIQQFYLPNKKNKGLERRVRSRKIWNDISYFYTSKISRTSDNRQIRERIITKREFETFVIMATKRIDKQRYVITNNNQTFEVDIFRRGQALCQVNLFDKESNIDFPDFLWISSEVTWDEKYLNYNLADNIND